MYSAIKINGKKLYEYARDGEAIQPEPRDIEIYNIELVEAGFHARPDEITFEVSCSKGTYIRTLCENIAEKLGTVGYMKALRRVSVDKFKIEDAIPLEDLKENLKLAREKIIPIEEIFANNKKIVLDKKNLELFLNGVMLEKQEEDGLFRVYSDNQFIGLGIVKNNLLKRDVVV